jgi:xylose isomerase
MRRIHSSELRRCAARTVRSTHGFDAVMFHDDDVVPDIDSKSSAAVLREARAVREVVEHAGMAVEMVAPRLWFSPMTVDGGFTSNDAAARQYALDRSLLALTP